MLARAGAGRLRRRDRGLHRGAGRGRQRDDGGAVNPKYLYDRGQCYRQMARGASRADLRKALEETPGELRLLYGAGVAAFEQGKDKECLACLEDMLAGWADALADAEAEALAEARAEIAAAEGEAGSESGEGKADEAEDGGAGAGADGGTTGGGSGLRKKTADWRPAGFGPNLLADVHYHIGLSHAKLGHEDRAIAAFTAAIGALPSAPAAGGEHRDVHAASNEGTRRLRKYLHERAKARQAAATASTAYLYEQAISDRRCR